MRHSDVPRPDSTVETPILECGNEQAESWDRFVTAASGTYCHLFGWKRVIERTYGLQTLFLAFGPSENWRAVLPIAFMPGLSGRYRKAVSLPYCNYGGLLAGPGIDRNSLRQEVLRFLAGKQISAVEFREMGSEAPGCKDVTMILSLSKSADLLWKRLGDKVRNQIRKAQRSGLSLRWGRDQAQELYGIYSQNMGRLGTPVHSRRFIQEILSNFPAQTDLLTVRLGDRAIGAMLVFKHAHIWADPFASSLAEFNSRNANMLLYWEALRAACEAGATSFDFGRSPRDSGTYRFKKQWGAQPIDLCYSNYLSGKKSSFSATSFYRSRTANKLASLWSFLPYFLQIRFGPILRRFMP